MIITKAKYHNSPVGDPNFVIEATIDGKTIWTPICVGNTHYDEILKWVAKGNTIEEAD
tara:strand:- start:47 stop:220 length:174 start_codon:yes stop_codon:yes gene_type:complete